MSDADDLTSQSFYHGTRAELKPGDLIKAGQTSNYGNRIRRPMCTSLALWMRLSGGRNWHWARDLAEFYVVEPTGPIMDDPNLTNTRYPGNPTKSYRSQEPLRVTGEVTNWQGHVRKRLGDEG